MHCLIVYKRSIELYLYCIQHAYVNYYSYIIQHVTRRSTNT